MSSTLQDAPQTGTQGTGTPGNGAPVEPDVRLAAPAAVLLATGQPARDEAFLPVLLAEAARFGLGHVVAVLPAGQPHQALDAMAKARGVTLHVRETAAAPGSLGALRAALPVVTDGFLLLDGAGVAESNLLALPLHAGDAPAALVTRPGPTAGWAGAAWMRAGLAAGLGADELPLHQALPPLLASGQARGVEATGRWLDPATTHALPARPAAFLDRDGVLIVDDHYPHDPAKVRWIPGAWQAVRRLNEAGYFVFVVTNQAGVGRGYYTEATVRHLHRWMAAEMAKAGAHIDAFEYCPHHPEAEVAAYRRSCHRRKPGPGMILDLMAHWPVEHAGSFIIGDRSTDVAAAAAAGLPGHLFPSDDLEAFCAQSLGKYLETAPLNSRVGA